MNGFVKFTACCLALSAGCQSTDRFTKWSHQDEIANAAASERIASRIEKESPGLQSKIAQQHPEKNPDENVRQGQLEVSEWYRDQSPQHLVKARQHFAAALSLTPQSSSAHHGLAIVADLEKNFGEAERHYQQALIQRPTDSDILGDMGYSYLLQNRLSESEQYSLRAVQANSKNVNAIKHLGDAYSRQGKTDLARETYSKVYSPEDVSKALVENAPTKPVEHAVKSSTSIFDRLNPAKSQGEKLIADVQQRTQEYEAKMNRQGNTGSRPGSPAAMQTRLASDARLRQQLQDIEQEGTYSQSGDTLLLDDQTGQITRLPGIENQHRMGTESANGSQFSSAGFTGAQYQQSSPMNSAPRPADTPYSQYASQHEYEPQHELRGQPVQEAMANQPAMAYEQDAQYAENQPQFPQRALNNAQRPWQGIQQVEAVNAEPDFQIVNQAYQQNANGLTNQVVVANGQVNAGTTARGQGYQGVPGNQYLNSNPMGSPMGAAGAQTAGNRPIGMNGNNGVRGNFNNQNQAGNFQNASQGMTPAGQASPAQAYEEASKAAARMGMGVAAGGMFPVFNQPGSIAPPGSMSYENSGAQPPQRWMPDQAPPQNLNEAYQPYPNPVRPPAVSQGGQMPPSVTPSYSQEQFGTASRYDTRTMQNSNIPQDYNASMQGYEAQRWAAGRDANIAVQEAWNKGPVNSPVSPTAGSIYTQPAAQGMMYTPNDPSANGQPGSFNTWPQAPVSSMDFQNPEAYQTHTFPPRSQSGQTAQSQQYRDDRASSLQAPSPAQQAGNNVDYRGPAQQQNPGMSHHSPSSASVSNGNMNGQAASVPGGQSFQQGNQNNIVIPAGYRDYNQAQAAGANSNGNAPSSNSDQGNWPTIIPASSSGSRNSRR